MKNVYSKSVINSFINFNDEYVIEKQSKRSLISESKDSKFNLQEEQSKILAKLSDINRDLTEKGKVFIKESCAWKKRKKKKKNTLQSMGSRIDSTSIKSGGSFIINNKVSHDKVPHDKASHDQIQNKINKINRKLKRNKAIKKANEEETEGNDIDKSIVIKISGIQEEQKKSSNSEFDSDSFSNSSSLNRDEEKSSAEIQSEESIESEELVEIRKDKTDEGVGVSFTNLNNRKLVKMKSNNPYKKNSIIDKVNEQRATLQPEMKENSKLKKIRQSTINDFNSESFTDKFKVSNLSSQEANMKDDERSSCITEGNQSITRSIKKHPIQKLINNEKKVDMETNLLKNELQVIQKKYQNKYQKSILGKENTLNNQENSKKIKNQNQNQNLNVVNIIKRNKLAILALQNKRRSVEKKNLQSKSPSSNKDNSFRINFKHKKKDFIKRVYGQKIKNTTVTKSFFIRSSSPKSKRRRRNISFSHPNDNKTHKQESERKLPQTNKFKADERFIKTVKGKFSPYQIQFANFKLKKHYSIKLEPKQKKLLNSSTFNKNNFFFVKVRN